MKVAVGSSSAAFSAPTLFQQQMSHMLHTVVCQPSLTFLLSVLLAGQSLFLFITFLL